jgi:peptide/nickel transport system permease protein
VSASISVGAIPAQARRRIRASSPVVAVSFAVIAVVAIFALFGQWIAPQHAGVQDLTLGLSKPSSHHWFGTDALGRDVLSRAIIGSRSALIGPLAIAGGSMIIGNILGLIAGFRGGKTDAVIMRWVDLMWSLPGLLVIIVVAATFGASYWLAVLLLVVLTVPFDARVVRGATLEQMPRPYVEAARTLGVSNLRLMAFHIWPNVSPVAVANSFLVFAGSLVALAGLSFLGLGVSPGTADWGLMVADGRSLLFANPVSVLAPSLMIVLTATSMNIIGDWVYERLASRGATR